MNAYHSTALFVSDIKASQTFYREVLELEPIEDNGLHLAYKGFALWDKTMADQLIFGKSQEKKSGGMELVLECDQLEMFWERIANHLSVITPLNAQPWGQLAVRVSDPDGHTIGLYEPFWQLIGRLRDQGMDDDDISRTTSIPIERLSLYEKAKS